MFSEKIRIAITDDSPIAISGIIDLLKGEEDLRIVGMYHDGKETIHGLNGNYTDVLLLDIHIAIESDMAILKELNYLHPTLRIILLTSYQNASLVKRCMKHGAKGSLIKSSTKEELNQAIQTIASGNEYQHPKLRQLQSQNAEASDITSHAIPELTTREKQILDLISEEYTSREIALELDVSNETFETCSIKLFEKFKVDNIARLVRVATEKGLL